MGSFYNADPHNKQTKYNNSNYEQQTNEPLVTRRYMSIRDQSGIVTIQKNNNIFHSRKLQQVRNQSGINEIQYSS